MAEESNRSWLRRRELLMAAGVSLFAGGVLLTGKPVAALPNVSPAALRRLNLRNQHTGESFVGTYRDQNGPIAEAMIDLAVLLRDHHADKVGPVDIAAVDFLAEVMAATGQARATILSAYRTRATNRRLIAAGFNAAEKSQHLRGHAVDVSFDAKLPEAMKAARGMKRGGVGWYPRSRFIHLDSGPVRNWDVGLTGLDKMLIDKTPVPRKPTEDHPLTIAERMKIHRDLARKEWLARQGG
jgi:uncharacterized protein YcbK (DUF882 family)